MEWHEATIWEATADVVGDRIAISKGADRRTWQQFENRAARLATVMIESGLGRGSRVGLMLSNVPELLEAYFAALKIRAVPFNVNFRYRETEVAFLLENARADALVFESAFADVAAGAIDRIGGLKLALEVNDSTHGNYALQYDAAVDAAVPAARIARDPNDVTLTYTGGTTGMPKAVAQRMGPGVQRGLGILPPLLGHAPITDPSEVAAFAASREAQQDWLVGLPAAPMIHATGLSLGALPPLALGGTVALLPSRSFDVAELWDTVERERVSSIAIVGDAFGRPMSRAIAEDDRRNLDSVRLLISSGALLSAKVKQDLIDRIPQLLVLDFVGATEGLMGVSISNKQTGASTGRFMPAEGVILVTEEGERIEPGSDAMGLIAVPGGEGYVGDEAATLKVTRTIDGQTYTLPGDWGRIAADGSMTLLGRGSTCINTAGEKVYPEEVEEILRAQPGVADALVFGIEDEDFGQRVAAIVSPLDAEAGLDPAVVIVGAKERLAGYKVPSRIVVVDEVPRTVVGKADLAAARAAYVEQAGRG